MPGGHPINFDPYPTINPAGAPQGDFEQINANPNMFGGLLARATEKFGQGVEDVGNAGLEVMQQRQQEDNQVHASELHSNFSLNGAKIVSDYSQLEGQSAYSQWEATVKKLQKLQKETEAQAGSPQEKMLVATNTRRTLDFLSGEIVKHADAQRRVWHTQVAKDNIDAATNLGGMAVLSSQFKTLDQQMDVVGAEAHNFLDTHGYDPQTLAVEVSKYKGKAVKNWVETAATNQNDPDNVGHALAIFERYTGQIDPQSRLEISKYVKSAAHERTVNRLADVYLTPPGRTADATIAPETRALLDTIHGSEAPNGGYGTVYTGREVGTLKPGFDYSEHPGIFFPGAYGPSSAFGRYQITKTTWDQDKARFGLSDITPQSQDQWAMMKTSEIYAKKFRTLGIPGLTGDLQQDLAANSGNPVFINAVGHTLSQEWTSLPGGLQPNAATPSFVNRFLRNLAINRGEAPEFDTAEAVQRIAKDPLFAGRPELQKSVMQNVLQKGAMMERAQGLANKQAKEQSDNAELEVFRRIHSDDKTLTLNDIFNNPLMDKAAKERMTEQFEARGGTSKADHTYGSGFYDIYRRVHLPEGDPERITDPNQLYSHVGPTGDLTVGGVDKLVKEIQDRRSPEGVAETEMKAQFLKNARAEITGSDEGLHIKDPKGDKLFLRFLAQALPIYDAQKRAGKSPAQLLDPESPDYIGKIIGNFRRPMNQWFADVIHDAPPGTQAEQQTEQPSRTREIAKSVGLGAVNALFPVLYPVTLDAPEYYEQLKSHYQPPAAMETPSEAAPADTAQSQTGGYSSLDDLVAAYEAGRVSTADAIGIATRNGWAERKPLRPEVPIR